MSIVQSGLPLALSIPFILAAWIALLHRQRVTANHGTTSYPTVDADPANSTGTCIAEARVDLAGALREAVVAVDSTACSRWVRIELAVVESVTMQTDPGALQIALRASLLTAINAAPGGQVLVTAATFGSQLHVRISDDGPGTDQQLRETSMHQTEVLIASQGGSIAVEARPGRGTTITIRLPIPASAEQQASEPMQLPVLADQAA